MSILQILNSIEATSSRNEKESILMNNKSEDLIRVLYLSYNPHINFYIRKIPPYTAATKNAKSLFDALNEVGALYSRSVTGHAAIAHLTNILSSLSADDAEVLERVILKDLRVGISESTINKVYKDLIPSYPCMLASAYDEKLIKKMKFPAAVQTKFDGMRFNAIVRGDSVEYRTRNGKELNLHGNLKEEFMSLAENMHSVFDGELLVLDKDKKNILTRKEGNGILSKAQKGTITPEEASRVIAVLWDYIPYTEFTQGHSTLVYSTRSAFITRKIDMLQRTTGMSRVRAARTHIANNLEEVKDLYQQALAAGEEGIILKDLNGEWEDKRVKHMVKFKAELEADLVCTDWIPGTGKYEGMLGALVLKSKDATVNVSVGSGFTDLDRQTLTREKVLNKVIAVKYNALIENKSGERSLFLPIYIEVREDKDEADTL